MMIGKTLHAIAVDESTEGVRPIQNPHRVMTETESHKFLYMPSRMTAANEVSLSAQVAGDARVTHNLVF